MVVLLLYFGVALTNAALAAEEVEYNITVPDYIDIEKNLTISNILSYSDVTNAYDAAPWGMDWGEKHAPYKWNVTTANGEVTIGFERYETISANPQSITFFRTVTELRGSHTETRYREVRQMPAGIQATARPTAEPTTQPTQKSLTPVPELLTIALMGLGLVSLCGYLAQKKLIPDTILIQTCFTVPVILPVGFLISSISCTTTALPTVEIVNELFV